MSENTARQWSVPDERPEGGAEACLRRAADYLEQGGLKDAAFWARMAADAIAEQKDAN